jgi:ethanolamine transporter EutH
MHLVAVVKILVLLMMANGTPVILKRLMGARPARPLDFGARFRDGRPIFGPSKTLRGLLGSLAVTSLVAPLLGLDWTAGLMVAVFAMLGDVFSSFTKRRLGLESGSMALGLDQIPESLLPFLALRSDLDLSAVDIVAGVATFFVGELVLSRILYRLGVRDRPY